MNWVVSEADRERYDELFKKTDTDSDGLINGTEVIEIFMLSSLSQTMLAQIWWAFIYLASSFSQNSYSGTSLIVVMNMHDNSVLCS